MLAIFESHPVQYRAPVYRQLHCLVPGLFHVFYATDVSMRGNHDADFGKSVAWDEPLLSGYPNTILTQERGEPLKGFRSLHGRGIARVFNTTRPKAILQTQFLYEFDFAILLQSVTRRIPVWMRQETQDEAFPRSATKDCLRSICYRLLYRCVHKAFFIGELNRQHLVRHGIAEDCLVRAPYCTPDRFADLSTAQHDAIRATCRDKLGIARDKLVVGFFGKLIDKKNPNLLLEAAPYLSSEFKRKTNFLFVGSGILESELKGKARQLENSGLQSVFAGFVNQSGIRDYYAATDILALPSQRAGETWGLVVNEGLQAGCAVVISDAVGCGREFGDWERVRIIETGNAKALARELEVLAALPRDVNWARERMRPYSILAAAESLAAEIRQLPR